MSVFIRQAASDSPASCLNPPAQGEANHCIWNPAYGIRLNGRHGLSANVVGSGSIANQTPESCDKLCINDSTQTCKEFAYGHTETEAGKCYLYN